MQLGKAAGVDGIETEHLRYAHPRICVMLSLLFSAVIIHGIVPSMTCLDLALLCRCSKAITWTVVCRIIIGVSPLVCIVCYRSSDQVTVAVLSRTCRWISQNVQQQKTLRCVFWRSTVIILQLLIYSTALRNVLVAVMLCIL